MTRVLVTGMSATGKSTVLAELARRGHCTVDTDYGDWIEVVDEERLWNCGRMDALLAAPVDGALFVAGCVANQGGFRDRFDAVVLLTAPRQTILDRLATRTSNPFGKRADERARILADLYTIEPLLRAAATHIVRTDRPPAGVVADLERIAGVAPYTG